MKRPIANSRHRFLNPFDRAAEVIYSVIIVMTFTGSLSVAERGEGAVRTMLYGAVGCNLAWGIVDAVIHLMAKLSQRARDRRLVHMLQSDSDTETAREIIVDSLPPVLAAHLAPESIESIRRELVEKAQTPVGIRFHKGDWIGALAVLAFVLLATFPVVVPFLLIDNATHALRVSNGVAILIMFAAGYSIGSYMGERPWRTGLAMVGIGVVLATVTIVLGG